MSKAATTLDAATALLAEMSWREISLDRLAARAGISRQTIYNEFGSRAGLEAAYVAREIEWFIGVFDAALRDGHEVQSALERAMSEVLAATRSNPLARAITRGDADELLILLTTRGRPVVTFAIERLAPLLERRWPWLEGARAAGIAESLVRLAISHGTLALDNDAVAAKSVAAIIAPAIEAARKDMGSGLALPHDVAMQDLTP